MQGNKPAGFAIGGRKPDRNSTVPMKGGFANRRRKRPQPDNFEVMVDVDNTDYTNSNVKPKRRNGKLGEFADQAQFKHQQFSKSRNRSKVKSDFDVDAGFGNSRKGNDRNGPSMLRNAGKHSQRTIFFDNSGSSPVTMEHLPTHQFVDPYVSPTVEDPKVFIKSLEFNLFKYIPQIGFDNSMEFERETLFKSMLLDIRRMFTSPQYMNITTEKLYNYFNAVALGVIEYYEIDSLMANDSYKYENINTGVRRLLDSAASETSLLETQYRLRRAIQGTYLPHKVFKLLVWMSQWYTFNEQGDSRATVFKFSLGLGLKNYYDVADPNYVIQRNAAFTSDKYHKYVDNLIKNIYTEQETPGIQTAIAKTYPEWAILDLPLSCNTPVYDQRATDLWLNTPALLKTNTTLSIEPRTEEELEFATMDEGKYDQIVPGCTTVKSVVDNRTHNHLDAVFNPTFHVAEYNSAGLWKIDYFATKNVLPDAQDPVSSVCALSIAASNEPLFKWLTDSTCNAIPDTYKLAYAGGTKRFKQFNSEVLRLKPYNELQKSIETCEYITRLLAD